MAKGNKQVAVSRGALEPMPRPHFFGDVDRLFEDFLTRQWMQPFGWQRPFFEAEALMPRVDVIDRADEVVIRAEVPGYRKEDLNISVSNNSLTIKGEAKGAQKEEKGDFVRCETWRGKFMRTIALPTMVDDANAHASVKDGVLELTLPKHEKAKPHPIAIS